MNPAFQCLHCGRHISQVREGIDIIIDGKEDQFLCDECLADMARSLGEVFGGPWGTVADALFDGGYFHGIRGYIRRFRVATPRKSKAANDT